MTKLAAKYIGRITALLLVMTMMFSSIPVTVLAAEASEQIPLIGHELYDDDVDALEYDFSEPEYDEEYLFEVDDDFDPSFIEEVDPDYILDFNDADHDMHIDFIPVDLSIMALDAPIEERVVITTTAQLVAFLNGTLRHDGTVAPNTADPNIAPNDAHFVLGSSITLTATTQGRGLVNGQPFTGIFDGNGFTITNLLLRRVAGGDIAGNPFNHNNSVGFIRVAGNGAIIRNLSFSNSFTQATPSFSAAGAGRTYILNNSAFVGHDVPMQNLRVGMAVGRVISGALTIENVNLAGRTYMHSGMQLSVAGTQAAARTRSIGGLIGSVENTAGVNIINISVNDFEVVNTPFAITSNARTHSVGGVIGRTYGTVNITTTNGVSDNAVAVMIRGQGRYNREHNAERGGGIIGFVGAGNVTINNTTVTGSPRVNPSHNDWFIRTTTYGGGFIGTTWSNGSISISNSTNNVNVSADRANLRVGGFIGRTGMRETTLNNVENHGLVRTGHYSQTPSAAAGAQNGGLIGRVDGIVTINDSINRGTVENAPRNAGTRSGFVGGIIGFANSAVTIRNTTNYANVIREGGWHGSNNHTGGIIGFINNGAIAANRRTTLINVTNHGNITPHRTSGDRQDARYGARHAGGIIGSVRDAASAVVVIDGALNTGDVRGRFNVGGIIGHANSRNITINNAMNTGLIHSIHAGRRSGGIVGLSNRADLTVLNSGNIGIVWNLRVNANGTTNTGGQNALEGGIGGIIGSTTGARTRVENSFNQGYIHAANFRVGGIIGQSRSSTDIINVYNIGAIRSGALRGGAGIVGQRTGGTTRITNAFVSALLTGGNATNDQTGSAVATSGTAVARPVAGLVFTNVFVDGSTSRVPATHISLQNNRNGITVVNTELITSGLLPGISNYPWMLGMEINNDPTFAQIEEFRTFPYFAWQTGGQLQPQFFDGILPIIDTTPGPVGTPITFSNVNANLTRAVFNPYRPNPTAVHSTGIHLPFTGNVATQRVGGNNHVSVGLISTNNVVGFGVGEIQPRFTVQAYDATLGPDAIIGHTIFDTNMTSGIELNTTGVLIARKAYANVNTTTFNATATGFSPVINHTLTAEDLVRGYVLIPMERIPMDIVVFVLNLPPPTGTEAAPIYTPVVLENSLVHHNNVSILRTPSSGAPGYHALTNAFVNDIVRGTAPGHSIEYNIIDPALFRRNDEGQLILNNGRYIVDIHVDDVRLPAFDIVPFWLEDAPDGTTGEAAGESMMFFANNARFTANIHLYADETRHGTRQTTVPRRFTVAANTSTELTSFVVVDNQGEFAPTEPFFVTREDLELDETGPAVPRIYVEMRHIPAEPRTLRVIERWIVTDGSEENLFVQEVIRPVPHDILTVLLDGGTDRVDALAAEGEFEIRPAREQLITADAIGFFPGEYVVSESEGDIEIELQRRPEPGRIIGHVLSSEASAALGIAIGDFVHGAIIEVRDAQGTLIYTTTTDANGFYRTGILPDGTFFVSARMPGMVPTQSHHNPVTVTGEEGAVADVFMRNLKVIGNLVVRVVRNLYNEDGDVNGYELVSTATLTRNGIVVIHLTDEESPLEWNFRLQNLNEDELGYVPLADLARLNDFLAANAPGFIGRTHTITMDDYCDVSNRFDITLNLSYTDDDESGYDTIQNMQVNVVQRTYSAIGEFVGYKPIIDSSLTLNDESDQITGNNGVFTVVASYINDVLNASAQGFTTESHVIVPEDYDGDGQWVVTIILEMLAVYDLEVWVVIPVSPIAAMSYGDENPPTNPWLQYNGAYEEPNLGRPAIYADFPQYEIIGSFVIDVAEIGSVLTAGAWGFADANPHTIIVQDAFADRIVMPLLDRVPVDGFIVNVVNSSGDPITTASLAWGTANITQVSPVNGTSGTFVLNGVEVDHVITANAPGFDANSVTVQWDDFDLYGQGEITIVLDQYITVPVTVRIVDENGVDIAGAELRHEGDLVVRNAGSFILNIDGSHVGDTLEASAIGFDNETHEIDFTDLIDANPVITIVLIRQMMNLIIANVPGTVTPTATQGGTAQLGTSAPIDLTFDGVANIVPFNSLVTLNAGAVVENKYFLGWYRGTAAPAAGTNINTLTIVSDAEHQFNKPETNTQYFALWGADDIIGNLIAEVTVRVVDETDVLITTSVLYHEGLPVTGNNGVFMLTLLGNNAGDILEASADGFNTNTHVVVTGDLEGADPIITITLTRRNFNLTVTNYPTVTPTAEQGGTAQLGIATPQTFLFNGIMNEIPFNASVVLNVGDIEENMQFLGWYMGATAPPVGTDVSTWGLNTDLVHTFDMPASDVQYFALWGARGIVGTPAAQITFHTYGVGAFDVDGAQVPSVIIPVVFGEPLDLSVINNYLLDDVNYYEFAFWGWFTDQALDASDRSSIATTGEPRRRPAVGTTGIDVSGIFTEASFNALATNGNIDLYAIWSLWGDVNDDDRVDGVDVDLLRWYILGVNIELNRAAAKVTRGVQISGADLDLIRWFVLGVDVVLGRPPVTNISAPAIAHPVVVLPQPEIDPDCSVYYGYACECGDGYDHVVCGDVDYDGDLYDDETEVYNPDDAQYQETEDATNDDDVVYDELSDEEDLYEDDSYDDDSYEEDADDYKLYTFESSKYDAYETSYKE